jgi:hypothetical protein
VLRPVVAQHSVDVLIRPLPVVAVEPPANRFDHPLCVAGIQVKLADQIIIPIGDGDRCLDRPGRYTLALQAQSVQSKGCSGLLAGRTRRNPEYARVVPTAADLHHLLLLPRSRNSLI